MIDKSFKASSISLKELRDILDEHIKIDGPDRKVNVNIKLTPMRYSTSKFPLMKMLMPKAKRKLGINFDVDKIIITVDELKNLHFYNRNSDEVSEYNKNTRDLLGIYNAVISGELKAYRSKFNWPLFVCANGYIYIYRLTKELQKIFDNAKMLEFEDEATSDHFNALVLLSYDDWSFKGKV